MPPDDKEILFVEFFNQKLKERGLSLPQLSEMTGISMKYMESFAHGRFENLPATPYLRGYFIRLGRILGFDGEEWWKRVREGDVAQAAGRHDRLPHNRYSLRKSRRLAVAGLIGILLVSYFGFRASKILGTPRLDIREPEADSMTVTQGYVTVAGEVKNADELTINGENVTIENDSFRKEVALQPGLNSLEIKARKLLGREAYVFKQIYYEVSLVDIMSQEGAGSPAATSSDEEAATTTEGGVE